MYYLTNLKISTKFKTVEDEVGIKSLTYFSELKDNLSSDDIDSHSSKRKKRY